MPVQGSQRTLAYQPTLGNMNTTELMKKSLAEGQLSVQLFGDYFGAPSYKRAAITQQVACDFGQSWPDLIYLPLCSFLDDTTRHQFFRNYIGIDPFYFKVVTAHEMAHQWWGHAVGFTSYRDQWMSEGFAHFSASLYLQIALRNIEEYRNFWAYQQRRLTERNQFGFRPAEVGALTMGYRLNTTRTGFNVAQNVIYPKGAFVLHMIRMMMWSPQDGDTQFKAMMHDFVSSYLNRAASTEDFKAIVEKHMTPAMDLDGNHNMDWFFNPFVYGTTMPNYDFQYSLDRAADGGVLLNVKLTQSNVDEKFRMLIPLYLEMGNGSVVRLGAARIEGNRTIQQQIPLGAMKDKPKRASINYFYDVLCTQSGN
jgi:aminopeptidase N